MDGEVVKIVTHHNHEAAQAARSEALRIVNSVHVRAQSTVEPPQQILAETLGNVHNAFGVHRKRVVRDARMAQVGYCRSP